MKLYYAPGACSLATRIALHEAGIAADFERVDLRTKTTEHGLDYRTINPKGPVPLIVLDDGATVTENVAILDLVAVREPKLAPEGPLGRTRLIEMLAYLSGELHVAFRPLFRGASDEARAAAAEAVVGRLDLIEPQVRQLHLFGERFTVADAYLFVMLRWARMFELGVPAAMLGYSERVAGRDAVRRAMAEEGLG